MPDQPKPVPSKKFGPKLMLGAAALVSFLAVWEGGNLERAGIKAFSPAWLELEIEA